MADIRINALPNEPTPNGTDVLPIDGTTTRKTTITAAVLAGRPTASQAEAEAGTDPTKAMTPLTTAQAVAFQGAAAFVPQARLLTAGAGLTGGGNLSADRTFAVDFTAVQPFSTKLTNLDGTSLTAGSLVFGAGANTWTVLPAGAPNQILQNIAGNPTWTNAAAGGDVTGPASSVDATIPLYSGTTGKILSSGNAALLDLLAAAAQTMPTIQNNAGDPTNDIDFLAGASISSDATRWPMRSTSTITKQLDAAWAAGTGAGGRMSAAAIANTTYFCYQIRNPTSGAVDFGFDVSPTAPTLPAGYTQYRMIAPIVRAAGVIKQFVQNGDEFLWTAGVGDAASLAVNTTAQGVTLTVPIGIKVNALFNASMISATVGALVLITSQDQAVAVANVPAGNFQLYVSVTGLASAGQFDIRTNTSGQIRVVASAAATFSVTTHGFIYNRGRA